MKSKPMRFGLRFGCRFGQTHDFVTLHENQARKIERCKICRKRMRWNIGKKKRVDSVPYLFAHARQYAQSSGATKTLFMRMHHKEKCKIIIHSHA